MSALVSPIRLAQARLAIARATAERERLATNHPVVHLLHGLGNSGAQRAVVASRAALVQRSCSCQGGSDPCHCHDHDEDEHTLKAPVQARLEVNQPNDPHEREADAVAEQVATSRSAPAPMVQRCAACGGADLDDKAYRPLPIMRSGISRIQRDDTEGCAPKSEEVPDEVKETQKEEEEEAAAEGSAAGGAAAGPVQRKASDALGVVSPDVEGAIERTRGRGEPLGAATRDFMGDRFGVDFSPVRVHHDAHADSLNRELRSYAFATGTDIYFRRGEYRPGTPAGDRLLAHELTHVVQQSAEPSLGGGVQPSRIQRAPLDDEIKPYYHSYIFQDGTVTGGVVHHKVEERLRAARPQSLVTEAPIPGGTTHREGFNLLGIADLYESTPAQTLVGVRGINRTDPTELPFQNVVKPKDVTPMPADATRSPRLTTPKGGGARQWHGDFPTHVQFGEIKPLGLTGTALLQVDHYRHGLPAFATQTHTLNNGATKVTPNTETPLSITIPAPLDFRQFDTEKQKKTGKDVITFGLRRIWIYALSKTGIYVYFDLNKDYTDPPPDYLTQELQKLEGVKRPLKPGTTVGKIAGKAVPGERAPLAAGRRVSRLQRTPTTQRNWDAERDSWLKQWANWAIPFRKGIKGTRRQFKERMKVEKRLGREAPAAEQTRVKQFKSLMFWSGPIGKFLGRLRFTFGKAWDKIVAVFEKMREKTTAARTKISSINTESFGLSGWGKKLVKVLVAAAKIALGRFVAEVFNLFVDCFQQAMGKVVDKLLQDLEEKFAKQICEARKKFEEAKEKLEKEWGDVIAMIHETLEMVSQAKYWLDIATTLVDTIRLGVQIISCLTPPALGCLWGIIVNIGLSAGLSLIIGTQWFNDNIVTPTIRNLVQRFAGPTVSGLFNRVLGPDLAAYHCTIPVTPLPSLDWKATGGLEGAALRRHRDDWENEFAPEIRDALKDALQGEDGKPATRQEVKELLDALKGLTPDEIRKVLKSSTKSGKMSVNLAAALAALQGTAGRVAEGKIGGKGTEPPTGETAPPETEPSSGKGTKPGSKGTGTTGAGGPTSGSGGGGADEGSGPPTYTAGDVPANYQKKPGTSHFKYGIAMGMDPNKAYTAGETLKVAIHMYFDDDPTNTPYLVYDVPIVFVSKKKTKDAPRGEYQFYFAKDFYVQGLDALVKGGPATQHPYIWGD